MKLSNKAKYVISIISIIVIVVVTLLLVFSDSNEPESIQEEVQEENQTIVLKGDGYSTRDFVWGEDSDFKALNAKGALYRALAAEDIVPQFIVPQYFPTHMGLVVDRLTVGRDVTAMLIPDSDVIEPIDDTRTKYSFSVELSDTSRWYIFGDEYEAYAIVAKETVN